MEDVSFIKIDDLRDFTKILEGQHVESNEWDDCSIYYVKEPQELFLIDFDYLKIYSKVESLKPFIFMFDMKVLMAVAGKYVPIYDKKTNELIFSKEEFLEYRKKNEWNRKFRSWKFYFF